MVFHQRPLPFISLRIEIMNTNIKLDLPFASRSFATFELCAASCGISRSQLYKWVSAGRLKIHKVGRKSLLAVPEVLKVVEGIDEALSV